MKKYRLIRNGYNVEWPDTYEDCMALIDKHMAEHINLKPVMIFHFDRDCNDVVIKKESIREIIIYQYSTIYTEVFMIEEAEI